MNSSFKIAVLESLENKHFKNSISDQTLHEKFLILLKNEKDKKVRLHFKKYLIENKK